MGTAVCWLEPPHIPPTHRTQHSLPPWTQEMEAAAVAWSADMFGTPVFCIKAVTDIVDGDRPAQVSMGGGGRGDVPGNQRSTWDASWQGGGSMHGKYAGGECLVPCHAKILIRCAWGSAKFGSIRPADQVSTSGGALRLAAPRCRRRNSWRTFTGRRTRCRPRCRECCSSSRASATASSDWLLGAGQRRRGCSCGSRSSRS